MNSVLNFQSPTRKVSIELYDSLIKQTSIKPDSKPASELKRIWGYYLSKNIDSTTEKLLKILMRYDFGVDGIKIQAKLIGKPHMEGMFDIHIYYLHRDQENLLLRIPVSVIDLDTIALHTVQGFRFVSDNNMKRLKRLSNEELSYSAIALHLISHIRKDNLKIVFQHPNDNIWHYQEMIRRNRSDTQLSIYESTLGKILKELYPKHSLRKIDVLYSLLDLPDHTVTMDMLEYTYLPYTKNTSDYHPTYVLRSHTYHEQYVIAYFASLDSLSQRPISKPSDLLKEIRFINL